MLFVSKIKDLRLIRRPSDRIMDEQRNPIILKGERVEFANFRYTTNDPDVIEWLCGHPLYGSQFTSDRMKDKSGKFRAEVLNDQETIDVARSLVRAYDPSTVPSGQQFEHMLQKDKKKKKDMPLMVKGMMATVQSISDSENPGKDESVRQESSLNKAEIASMIRDEVSSAVAQLVELLKPIVPSAQLVEPTKKVFTCPDCGEKFPSGIAVGAHKKAIHAVKEVAPKQETSEITANE